MITFAAYRRFLTDLVGQGIYSQPVYTLAKNPLLPGTLMIKHDVEARVDRAVHMARIEADCGHMVTYYFQGDLLRESGVPYMVGEMAAMGHEIGYHYDVLDACDGNLDAAIREFDRYLALIQAASGSPVLTVCPHGNPTKLRDSWRSNKDFFRASNVRARYPGMIDIVIDFPHCMPAGRYVSDAGFKLRVISEIATNDLATEGGVTDGECVDWPDVAQFVLKSTGLVLSTHPHRVQEHKYRLVFERGAFFFVRSGYQFAKHIPYVSKAASQLYRITRWF